MSEEPCATCRRPRFACVCDRIVRYPTARRVLILQHPQEQDALLGSAQIVIASLPNAKLTIGLSFRNLAHALGEEDTDPRGWAVLFPDRDVVSTGAPPTPPPGSAKVVTPRGGVLAAEDLRGVIVLDGTWSKAKTLWWRNPWLNKLRRMTLKPREPSIYGRLRAEPRRDYVSTLESVGAALTLMGEPPEVEAGLRRVFRTLVQRVRDAHVSPDALRLPRSTRAPREPSPTGGEGSGPPPC